MLKQPFYNLDGVENNFAKLYGENTVAQKERYQNAYENYLRSLGYRIKYKWTWKNYRDLLITIGIILIMLSKRKVTNH